MASYQDIEVRLRVLEDKVEFFLGQFKVQKQTFTGLVDANGQPQVLVETQSLAEHYRELKNGALTPLKVNDGDIVESAPVA